MNDENEFIDGNQEEKHAGQWGADQSNQRTTAHGTKGHGAIPCILPVGLHSHPQLQTCSDWIGPQAKLIGPYRSY